MLRMMLKKVFPVVVACGALAVLSGFYEVFLSVRASAWPQVKGIITGAGPRYEYIVKGAKYGASAITAAELGGFTISAILNGGKNLTAKYPEGSAVQARYNPGNPADSVLDASMPPSAELSIFAGMAMVVGGFTGMIFYGRK